MTLAAAFYSSDIQLFNLRRPYTSKMMTETLDCGEVETLLTYRLRERGGGNSLNARFRPNW